MAGTLKINWGLIEGDWRAGIKSVRQIAGDYAKSTGMIINHSSITKHFKRLEVTRDLQPQIKKMAADKVNKSIVNSKSPTDSQTLAANADLLTGIQLSHRKDVGRHKAIVTKLLSEIEQQTDNVHLYEQMLELVEMEGKSSDDQVQTKAEQDRMTRRRQILEKAISTSGRIDSVKKLVESFRMVVELERKIYGIDSGGIGEDTLESGLTQVALSEKVSEHAAQ